MRGFILFAAKNPNIQIAVFESVQQAYTQGLELMHWLRDDMERRTHDRWTIYHVLHNGYSLGGSSIRRRYFFVLSRIPFGIDPPQPTRVPVLRDVIGDLAGMAITWEHQPYRRDPSWWLTEQGMRNGVHPSVDGHMNKTNMGVQRNFDLITEDNPWPVKKVTSDMVERYYDRYGDLPESWQHMKEKLLRNRDPVTGKFRMGYIQPCRWDPDRAARVITGAGMMTGIHPFEDRMFTHREVARIMGFPDDWRIYPNRHHNQLAFNWGKGILVQCGRWIGSWVQAALDGEPSDCTGDEIGEREHLFQYTHMHRHLSHER
jgi:site-specific DNA-cytosine methylase